MYSYKKENTDIKTLYTIEFTRDQKVFEIMNTANFDFNMLNKKTFDYLQEAINLYNVLFYEESVLHIMLYEQIILNGEIILEQEKDMRSVNILSQETQRQIKKVEYENDLLKEENKIMSEFLSKYNINVTKIRNKEVVTHEQQ